MNKKATIIFALVLAFASVASADPIKDIFAGLTAAIGAPVLVVRAAHEDEGFACKRNPEPGISLACFSAEQEVLLLVKGDPARLASYFLPDPDGALCSNIISELKKRRGAPAQVKDGLYFWRTPSGLISAGHVEDMCSLGAA